MRSRAFRLFPFLLLSPALSLGAQQRSAPRDSAGAPNDSLSADSLAARLERAERAIALLRQQVADESQAAVRTRSRFQLELNGRVLTNTFSTSGRVNSLDVPILALERGAEPNDARVLGVTVRQTRFGASLSVSDVLGGTFEGSADLDFAGGVQNGPGDRRLFPEPRMRTAWGRIVWDRTELLVGSETPLISDMNPISVAAVGVTEFVAAGNLWNWLPQARLTRELGTVRLGAAALRIGAQGAVLAPVSGSQYPGESDAVDAAERSGRPFLEGRLRARWGDPGAAPASDAALGEGGEVGIGVHRGWVATSDSTTRSSRALSADLRVSLTRFLELRGEGYAGRLLRGLGGGGIGQNFGIAAPGEPLGPPVRDVAGWAQLNLQAHPLLITGVGCGVDRTNPDDRPTRLRNGACAAHLLWRPAQPVLLGAEYRRLRTVYASGPSTADHFNLALGFEF